MIIYLWKNLWKTQMVTDALASVFVHHEQLQHDLLCVFETNKHVVVHSHQIVYCLVYNNVYHMVDLMFE